jgi:D-lactate dehydrogenase (cytochrome)
VREQHGRDEGSLQAPPPSAVVFAESTGQDVADAVKLASQYEVPVIPYGAGRRSKATCWPCRAASAST